MKCGCRRQEGGVNMTREKTRPSLESIIEREDLGLEILHPGGLDITRELVEPCKIGKDSFVLDVASGTGESACYLAEGLGARIIGIDISDAMIERAKRKAMLQNLAVEFKKGDAHQLPFDDATFDAVVSECTTSILTKEQAIREMARVVKPGGCVGIHDLCWKEDTPEQMKKKLAEIGGERPETLEGWKALFEKAGLVDVIALDKSPLISGRMKSGRKKLGLSRLFTLYLKVLRIWGIAGLRHVWETERIFQSRHTGYGVIAGKKP
jgi:SAM-dependent methyltransferase